MPQQIQSVTMSQAPITAVLLVEFAATNYNFMYDALNASYMFASNLQPQDWVAVVEFDMKTTSWWTSPRTSRPSSGR